MNTYAATQLEIQNDFADVQGFIQRQKQKQSAVRQIIKVNNSKTAAVAQDFYWIPVKETPPPLGVKLLLINQELGVACMGTYSKNLSWTHWQGLPKFQST